MAERKGIFGVVSELIGRTRRVVISMLNRRPWRATTDLTQADYKFYDLAANGMAQGLELAGLLMKPINSKIASWVLGMLPEFDTENPLQEDLSKWFKNNHSEIMRAYREAVKLGDFYIVVNPDLSISLVSPDVVEPIVAEDNYSEIIGWRLRQRYQHPTELGRWQIEINEFYPDVRIRIVENENGVQSEERFPNLIGRIPIIHIANNKGSNSAFGTPEAAPLVATQDGILYRYDEVLDAGINGNIKQGRPTPAINFSDKKALDAYYAANARKIGVDADTGEDIIEVPFDSDKLVMTVGGGFGYAQPGAFAKETETILSILYWLILEHIEIPEFVMGTAIASSKASAETQMPVFIRWIEAKRGDVSGWLLELAQVVMGYLRATSPNAGDADINLIWEDLSGEDGQLTLEVVRWAYTEGLIDRETALQLAPVKIMNIQEVLDKADSENEDPEQDNENEFQENLDEEMLMPAAA